MSMQYVYLYYFFLAVEANKIRDSFIFPRSIKNTFSTEKKCRHHITVLYHSTEGLTVSIERPSRIEKDKREYELRTLVLSWT